MADDWISMHIFYASNQNPMLVEAVEPLVKDLRARGLLQRFFFIKYWQEGPHIRLRLLPAAGVPGEQVQEIADSAIQAYLQRRPALYSIDDESIVPFYKDMFLKEYGEEEWVKKYGAEGKMPTQANNSIQYIAYEPELGRYGGVEGVELAEWHFERSSEIVIHLIRETNVHVRTILLGQGFQLALFFCYAFLDEDQEIVEFLARYEEIWKDNYYQRNADLTPIMEKGYLKMAPRLHQRASEIRSYMVEGQAINLTRLEKEWAMHVRELRQRVDELADARKLSFLSRVVGPEPFVPDTSLATRSILLSSYLHMTNNRLGISILDEIPLAYLIRRTLENRKHMAQEATL